MTMMIVLMNHTKLNMRHSKSTYFARDLFEKHAIQIDVISYRIELSPRVVHPSGGEKNGRNPKHVLCENLKNFFLVKCCLQAVMMDALISTFVNGARRPPILPDPNRPETENEGEFT